MSPSTIELTPVFDYFDALIPAQGEQSTCYIGLSGGVDSVVLLHICANWCQQRVEQRVDAPKLVALHINHDLSDKSDQWQRFCQALCADLSVEFIAEPVGVLIEGASNVELQARKARYRAFEKHLQKGDKLLLGHHQDDQLETFLLRAFRGSGPSGLGAIPQVRPMGRGELHRPLLNTRRDQLVAYAQQHKLTWVEDESNQNTDFDRNYIRHQLVPVIKARWQSVGETVSRSAELCRDNQQLIDDLAELDLASLCSKGLWGEPRLDCQLLQNLSLARQANTLRRWFAHHTEFKQPILMPSQFQLQQILSDLVKAPSDSAAEVVWGQYCCRVFKGHLYLLDAEKLKQCREQIEQVKPVDWNGCSSIRLACGGVLSSSATEPQNLSVQYRQGGEAIVLEKRGTKKLKAILQELEVPPWHREKLPLIYREGELIAMADLCQTEKARAILPKLRYCVKSLTDMA